MIIPFSLGYLFVPNDVAGRLFGFLDLLVIDEETRGSSKFYNMGVALFFILVGEPTLEKVWAGNRFDAN